LHLPFAMNADDAQASLRNTLGIGYAILIACNVGSAAKKFGPDNRTLSDAYPTSITPAGATFAIWGPIFLLQGSSTCGMVLGTLPGKLVSAVAPAWLCTWFAESAWLLLFARMPVPPEKAGRKEKLAVLLPCQCLLFTGQVGMWAAAFRLRWALADSLPAPSLARAAIVDFPTGLNAGWLGAAAGIGMLMTCQQVPVLKGLNTPTGGAALVGAVAICNLGACIGFGGALGLGYGFVTAWACRGISKNERLSPMVRRVARLFTPISLTVSTLVATWTPLHALAAK